LITACDSTNKSFFYGDVVIGKEYSTLDFDASGVENMMKNRQLVYLIYFYRDSEFYPFSLQLDTKQYVWDINPLNVLFNPTIPVYTFRVFNYTPYPDPNYLPHGSYTQKLLIPMSPKNTTSAKLVYLFFLAPHGTTP